jgi:hypothetical protein
VKLTDADLLDVVRRLRSYMSTMDNVDNTLNLAQDIDDPTIVKQVQALLVDIPPITLRCAHVLRAVEATKQYREMIKKYNLTEDDEDGED